MKNQKKYIQEKKADLPGLPTDKEDWLDHLTDAEKASLERGLRDIENGNLIPHAEVMKRYEKWIDN